jgi:hypothetical protein
MSSILYYSNFCDHSKKLLQNITKTAIIDDVNFICIDKRISENGKIYIILENGQKLVMPSNIDKVPALLVLNNFKVLYGEEIYNYLKPIQKEQVKQATFNNMEPMAFCLGSSYGGIVSDNFSFLDMDSESLKAKGDGGLRQMHNYVSLNDTMNINTPVEDFNTSQQNKLPEGLTVEKLQQQREQEFNSINKSRQMFV